MKMLDVKIALEDLRDAREKWHQSFVDFRSGYEAALTRLVHEAAANFMSDRDIARSLGVPVKTVRNKMRLVGLDPKSGKRALSKRASDALIENAALLGIEPAQMDLTSPLAYLPMGEQLRKQLQDQTLARVTELPESVSGNLTDDEWLAFCDLTAESGYDASRAEALWPGFTKPGGDILRLALDALLRSRA